MALLLSLNTIYLVISMYAQSPFKWIYNSRSIDVSIKRLKYLLEGVILGILKFMISGRFHVCEISSTFH